MNKHNAHQYLHLIKALAEGKQVQYKPMFDNKWYDGTDLTFSLPPEQYRIKSEPIKQEFYYITRIEDIFTGDNEGVYINLHKDLPSAQEYLKKIDPKGESYVIMHANIKSIESV
jgi:hypothetical protein